MAVSYIRVKALADMFAPAVRAFGNIAVVGPIDERARPLRDRDGRDIPFPAVGAAEAVTNPASAKARFPGTLADSISLAFAQTPCPSLIYGVRVDAARPDWDAALTVADGLDAQFVVLAGVVADRASITRGGPIALLASHVISTSNTGEDGRERMGVAMLRAGSTDTAVVAGDVANERMVFVAHKGTADIAAAVAGTIAGYEPHISVLLKQVNVASDPFTAAEISTINGSETFDSGPAGQGVLWLTDPALIPGRGTYLGEAYTANPGGKKYIDIVRTVDDVSFRLKARLIATVGNLRISRSGLRSLVSQMDAVLTPLVRNQVIEGHEITIPVLTLLDKDPAALTDSERRQIDDAQSNRVVEVFASLDYAGAIHRIALSLKFT